MAIERIDVDLCNGCGICANTCWLDVIRMDEGSNKAVIKYPNECSACRFCQMDCPQKAISISAIREEPALTMWGT